MINMAEYATRRQALIKKMQKNSIALIPAAPIRVRNNDVHYPYRQDNNVSDVSGFEEPEAVIVIAPQSPHGDYILFVRDRDPEHEIWDGKRAGVDGAVTDYHANHAFSMTKFQEMLPELLAGRDYVYYPMGQEMAFDRLLLKTMKALHTKSRSGIKAPDCLLDISPLIYEARLFKSPAELKLMQKAADISVLAHTKAMQTAKVGQFEYELEAELLYEFYRHGSRSPAYPSIVGTGENACTLHYVANTARLVKGDLVLIDAGAEYQNYAADITRTFPATGQFSGEQRAIYDLVLAAQLAALKVIKPGMHWEKAQDEIVRVITQGLVDLKILAGNVDDLIEKNAYSAFYMHRSGHWLGLDVHDVGQYKIKNAWRNLEPGMALTVEPGIYISKRIPNVDERWHNIGIRIEDDVYVTKDGHHVMTQQLPKTSKDIEALMRDKFLG